MAENNGQPSGESQAPAWAPIRLVERGGELPLSFAQERMWFLQQWDERSSVYNLPVDTLLEGTLDLPALAWSLQQIVRRHEALRTLFPVAGGRPVAIAAPELELALPVIDLGGLPRARRGVEAIRLAAAELGRCFDLATGPLLRVSVVRLAPRRHALLGTLHHIVGDGWSTGVLIGELGVLYRSRISGEPASLPALPCQYADFAQWQREWLRDGVLAEQLGYWRSRLTGAPEALALPVDRPRPARPTFRGSRLPIALPYALSRELSALAGSAGASLFMVLLAGFATLLARHSGEADLVIGSPIANRSRREIEQLIGLFANILALRLDLGGDPHFKTLLSRVRDVALDAYENQDLPFERLVEELRPRRDPSRTPLFQVVLVLQNTPREPLRLPGLTLSSIPVESATAKLDLTLELTETPRGIVGVLEHSTDLFDRATVGRLAGHLEVLLSGAVAAPSRRLSELPLLSKAERQQLLAEWNAASPEESRRPACLHRVFEAQAARAPEALSVTLEGRSWTYSELNRRANVVARALRRAGVACGTLVGLCAEPSLELVAGILAILKAGGAYLPLDPTYPRQRLELLLADTAAPVVLTTAELAARLPAGEGGRTVLFEDADRADPAEEGEAAAGDLIGGDLPEAAAYVIHTSGSTGRPKGVVVSHQQALRLFTATERWFGFGESDVWTLFHSFAFDFAVWELWGALLQGGRLVIVPPLVSRSPEAFVELLRRERVTILNQTPAAFHQLVQAEGDARDRQPLALRWVVLGGDALEPVSLAPWFELHGEGQPRIANMYGITETTVHVTFHCLGTVDLTVGGRAAIGRPLPDLQVHVADASLRLLPAGACGELYVGGAGVAMGYHGRADLTAERFLPDPWSAKPGARLYRSGDLVRRRPDGVLEYLGRLDKQVKVRGFRIEPGEVEAALARHPAIDRAVVAARPDGDGVRRLVAYFVAARAVARPAVEELRAFLLRLLPAPMVPATFVCLEALPLTAHGKVDREALPEPGAQRPDLAHAFVAPRSAVEEVLAAIWSEVLGIDRVGTEDDFFDLGGHSLLATQVVSRIRQALRVELSLQELFGATTVARLAALVFRNATRERSEKIARLWLRVHRMSEDEVRRERELRTLRIGDYGDAQEQ